jgi:hypothetical protein
MSSTHSISRILPVIALTAAALLSGACRRTPSGVLSEEEMAQLLADIHIADAFVQDQRMGLADNDSARQAVKNAVLAKHGVTQAQLDSSFHWYGHNLARYIEVYERVDTILGDSLRAINSAAHQELAAAAGDSTNVWNLQPAYVFSPRSASNFVTFSIEADSTWKRGDVYQWQMTVENNTSPLRLTMLVDYANRNRTTEVLESTAFFEPGRATLEFRLDSTMNAKRIYGFMQLSPREGERAFVDSIKLIRTRLIHDRYTSARRNVRSFKRNDL